MEDKDKQIQLLEKELLKCKKFNTVGEKIWLNIAKFGGLVLMLLPFIPNAFFYLGIVDEKTEVVGSDYWYMIGGAVLFFAQTYVGELLNALGKKLIQKVS